MKIRTFLTKDPEQFQKEITKTKQEFMPDLYILFLPSNYIMKNEYHEKLHKTLYPSGCVGVSSIAAMKNDSLEYDAFGGMAIKFEKNGSYEYFFRTNFKEHDLIQLRKEILDFLQEEANTTYFVFSTGSNLGINHILDFIFKKEKYPRVKIYGGIASSNLVNLVNFISVDGSITTDGFVIVKLKNVVSYNTISYGFLTVGVLHTITKAEGNKIYEIDEKPVSEFLSNLIRETSMDIMELESLERMKELWGFPISIFDKERGYIVTTRTMKKFNPAENSLELYGNVKEGQIFKIALGDSEDILSDVYSRASEFYGILISQMKNPEVILNISCAARNIILNDDNKDQEEQKIYHGFLRNYEMIGFLSFGEIGPDRLGKPGQFFNETSILIGLEEV